MSLLKAFTLVLACSYGSTEVLKQTQLSISRAASRTARIECHVAVSDFGRAYLHWYRQRPGAAPERILYFSLQVHVDQQHSYSVEIAVLAKSSRMFLLQVLILALFWPYGHAQLLLQQIQTSVTKEQYKTARMDCKISGLQNFKSAVIHWYQQISSRAPEWILFISESEPSIDQHFDKNKFHCEKDPNKQISTLTDWQVIVDEQVEMPKC
ncbi:hypothetical protein Y1Q_0017524 [Alligator mississippiensis]|uniref:Ig-like domain-containing protein n=1 Tax=Alligator mississippiensis TaxID=8496 RepID=A0A151P2A1_ALLMI|nr:hypothetical protein Y1Q_0017524 [Alligator mississippiensis]